MSCVRCAGLLIEETVLISEGQLFLSKCVNCGRRQEVGLIPSAPPMRPDLERRRTWKMKRFEPR